MQCRSCGNNKDLSCFRKHDRGGYRRKCRACENEEYRLNTKWDTPERRAYAARRRLKARGFSLTADAKRRAKDKGLLFDLDWRDIQSRIDKGFCEVTGFQFDLTMSKAWNAPSLDQRIPQGGYTAENTRVVVYALNVMAHAWGEDVILKIADAIRGKRDRK